MKIVDPDGRVVMRMEADVERKEQRAGKIGGDVDETLHVANGYKFYSERDPASLISRKIPKHGHR